MIMLDHKFSKQGTTFTSYSNAYALYIGLKELGVELSVAREDSNEPEFPIPINNFNEDGKWLFFTEEASLAKALRGEISGEFYPKKFPENLLDDKWALSVWLTGRPELTSGLQQLSLAEKNLTTFPCLLKSKQSWQKDKKTPRGWVCESLAELDKYLEIAKADGFLEDSFFIQEWLGNSCCRVISVCGFHDHENSERNLFAVVERIAAHSSGLSCSAAVETIDDNWDLIEKTVAILNALKFTGPYELEFIVTKDRVCVLELNPRFWMQHAIFLKTGNGVLKRYLGIESLADRNLKILKNVAWFDSLHLLKSLLSWNFDFYKLFRAKRRSGKYFVLLWPSIPMAIYVWIRLLWSKRKKVFQKLGVIFKAKWNHAT